MHYFNIDNERINYTITKKKSKKNLSIYVKYPDIVSVVCHSSLDDEYIHDCVVSKSKWIYKKLLEFKNRNIEKNTIKDGSYFTYFGKEYSISTLVHKKYNSYSLQVTDNKFIFEIPLDSTPLELEENCIKLLVNFLIKQGSLDVKKRIDYYSKLLNVYPNSVKVNHKKTSWGSCSSLKNININAKLLLTPLPIIDYVLVHELCHLKEMNHSSKFWKHVEAIVPDYKDKRNWLKENSSSLIL